jgi:hypothetical protein
MSDQFALIDARGRAAGAALRTTTSFRALPDLPTPKRHGWVRPAIVAALVIAVVVGLVAVAGRDAAPVDERDPKNLRYVVDDLPDGWSIRSRTDATRTPADPIPGLTVALYGTSGDPTAPVVMMRWSTPESPNGQSFPGMGYSALATATEVQEFTVGDWHAACGTEENDRVVCLVETDRGFVLFSARRLPVDAVRTMASALTFVGESPQVAPESLPREVTPLYPSPLGQYFPAGSPGSGRASAVELLGSDTASAALTVSWADETDIAYLGLDDGWTATTMAGRSVFHQVMHADVETILETIVWIEGDRTFFLRVMNAPAATAEQLVANVRPASDTEWEAIHATGGDTPITEGTSPMGTDVAETTPTPTVDPSAPITDVVVSMEMNPLTDHQLEVVAGDPTSPVQVFVSYVVDTYSVRSPEGGGFTSRSPMQGTALQFAQNVANSGLFALSEDPDATELVVLVSDGTRRHVKLQQLFDGAPGRFAMVAVRWDQILGAQVLAADGTVLTEIPAFG